MFFYRTRLRLSATLFGLAEQCYRFADKMDPPETVTFPVAPSEWPVKGWRR